MTNTRQLLFESLERRITLSTNAAESFTLLDFEVDELPDRDWVLSQPIGEGGVFLGPKGDGGTDHLSIAAGEGRDGSNALLVESRTEEAGLPGFWLFKGLSALDPDGNVYLDQYADDQGYLLPRGLRANRLEFWLRFEDGYRSNYSADSTSNRTIDVGTYQFDPGKESDRVVESDNWHFYHKLVLRHDQAGSDWIHVVLNEIPQGQRSVSQGRPELNPTSPAGNYWELLTRVYFDATPYFSDPEIDHPLKMWVDDIKFSYVPPSDAVQIQIENYTNGQHVKLESVQVSEFSATITNSSDDEVRGTVVRRNAWQVASSLLDPITREPVDAEIAMGPGETREFLLQYDPKDSLGNGRRFPLGLIFLPEGDISDGNHSIADSNVELRNAFGYSGPADSNAVGSFFNAEIGATENNPPTVQGGMTFETDVDTTMKGTLPAADPEGDSLTFTLLDQSTDGGALSLDSETGEFEFRPRQGFEGIFRFRYLVSDGNLDSRPAASWISVRPIGKLAEATDDSFVAELGRTAFGNVLENDTYSSPLAVTHVNAQVENVGARIQGDYGAIVLDRDGAFAFTIDEDNPEIKALQPGQSLLESFVYTVAGGSSATLEISIVGPLTRVAGDATGDGLFNSSDLVAAFAAGEYEDNIRYNSAFTEGDWNGDGEFDSSDLVFAFRQGSYETPSPANALDAGRIDAAFTTL